MSLDQPNTALDPRCPSGPLAERWTKHLSEIKLVAPANKRKHTIIVVGTGLAGGSAAATLAELGYNVINLCIQDSPRRAHSVAAQGGVPDATVPAMAPTPPAASAADPPAASTS